MRIEPGTALHDAVIAAVGHADAVVTDAAREPLDYDAFLAYRAVHRLRGTADTGGDRVPWSLIEKTTEGPHAASPYLRDNALREHAAYTSGLLDDLAPAVRAPALLGSAVGPDGRISLWIEDLPPTVPRPLDGAALLGAASDLGGLAGAWVGRVPDEPWLFDGWIDRHAQPGAVEDGVAVLERADRTRHGWVDAAAGLAGEQARVRDILESLPVTLCHHDAVGANVFRDPGGTVLIDWESVGPGPVGADLASLLFSSARRGDCSADLAVRLVELALAAYTDAVQRATGRRTTVSAEDVRRGFEASVALRWKLAADVAAAVQDGTAVRRGSAPEESPERALTALEALVGLLVSCARRLLG